MDDLGERILIAALDSGGSLSVRRIMRGARVGQGASAFTNADAYQRVERMLGAGLFVRAQRPAFYDLTEEGTGVADGVSEHQ